MRGNTVGLSLLILTLACAAPEPAPEARTAALAPRLEGLGDHHRAITTASPEAQRFFDQGLVLTYGFNHAEAARSFREASRLDPGCAMCSWGLALALGRNINSTMEDDAVPEAWAAITRARELAATATEAERDLIEALARRYSETPPEDRAPLDQAYADAMREVARRHPDDLDAATLFADALMNTTPWDYWTEGGEPKEVTREILATLDSVLARNPDHPGANHLYIHAVEAVRPELGLAAADRLRDLVPGAGHLVHMPSHIYLRVGRYHDASVANERAIQADLDYSAQCHAQGLYPLVYMPHNRHFLWAAATLEGRSEVALAAAREMAEQTDQQEMRQEGLETLQHYWITPLYGLVRFGRWQEILDTPEPAADLTYPRGVWRYARAMAELRSGRLAEAEAELARLQEIAADPELERITIWDLNTTADLIDLAVEIVAGELAAARGDYEAAVDHLQAAIEIEDGLNYDEPPPWHAPARQMLGAILLAASRPAEAEAVYREDLQKVPENGWSLFGLTASLEAQGKAEEAAAARERFATAWQYADVTLTASRF